MTPLMKASLEGHIDVARILIQAGAEIDSGQVSMFRRMLFCWGSDFVRAEFAAPGENDWTPLMWAAFKGRTLVARELLLSGADPRLFDLEGYDVRSIAILGECGDDVIRLLDAWGSIQALWVIRSAGQVRQRGAKSSLKRIPKDLCRMLGSLIV
jgi:hypothetical protein